jgi:hypothetical protein
VWNPATRALILCSESYATAAWNFGLQIVAIEHFDADNLSVDRIEMATARESQGEVARRIGRGSIWNRVEVEQKLASQRQRSKMARSVTFSARAASPFSCNSSLNSVSSSGATSWRRDAVMTVGFLS